MLYHACRGLLDGYNRICIGPPVFLPNGIGLGWKRLWFAMLAGLCVIFAGLQPAMSGEEYVLGPQDKVRLKVFEWRPSQDAFFEWTALNDIFTVGADGKVSLPFASSVQAQGLSTSALARRIAESLKQHMGLGRAPDVSVEVAQFRPIYVVGRVMQSGDFPYRPGLTVLQAVSLAGGLRIRDVPAARIEREIISGRGDVDLLRLNKINLLARRARLQAEEADANEITFPDLLVRSSDNRLVQSAMQQERAIFETRRKSQQNQMQALMQLRDFLKKEQESLNGHLAFQDRQIELIQKDLDGISTLVKKGFATESRQTALERAMVQARSDRLTAETALLRAQQDMSRTELNMLDLKNNFDREVRTSLRETQSNLNDIERRAQTASQLLYDSEVAGPRLAGQRNRAAQAQPIYSIVRGTPNGFTELSATESTVVEPGDTVKVEIPYDAGGGELDITATNTDPTGTSSLTSASDGDTGPAPAPVEHQ